VPLVAPLTCRVVCWYLRVGLHLGDWLSEVCPRKMHKLHAAGKSRSCGFLEHGVGNIKWNEAELESLTFF